MPGATVREFWRKVHQDPELKNQLVAIQGKEEQAVVAAVLKLAAEAGFVFTAQEYLAAKEELARQHDASELTEEQLLLIVGGKKGYIATT
jgi:predicted ribosomally synthesized peptide with nif11-like leader